MAAERNENESNHDNDQTTELTKPVKFAARIVDELGLHAVWRAAWDVKLLYAQRCVRLFGYGASTLILVSYLKALDISETKVGLFMTLTLIGDVGISFLLTLYADRLGRKAVLALGSTLMVISGLVFAGSSNYWVLLAAAIFGIISPSGNEIGPFRAVEESALATLVPKPDLGAIYAWYSLVGTGGAALGMMFCGWMLTYLTHERHWTLERGYRFMFTIYAALGCGKFVLSICLSENVEVSPQPEPLDAATTASRPRGPSETEPLLQNQERAEQPEPTEPPKKRGIFSFSTAEKILLVQLSILFALDSFASGLVPLSWVTYFFKDKFNIREGELGSIFFVTSIIQAGSMLVAASIARRIGNVKTMALTHLPSAIMLALIPAPSQLPLALALLIGRSCTQSMDVAPRSAFLATVLPDDKRTAIMGYINVVKTASQSVGPVVTGSLAGQGLFWIAFVVAGATKTVYDLGILFTFATTEQRHRER